MVKLIEILKKETQSLKEQYFEKTLEWAEAEYDRQKEIAKWDTRQWCEYLRVGPRLVNPGQRGEFWGFPNGFFNTDKARTYDNKRNEAKRIAAKSLDTYKESMQKKAERHYEQSMEKLAYRIEKKKLEQDKLQVETAHIGANIETTLTDGNKKVRAFTVLAWGPIQRPHYRYLVR